MWPKPKVVLWHGVARATSDELKLAAVGAAVTGAVLLESWLLAGATALAYLVAVGADLCRPRFWERVVREVRRRPPRLPVDVELGDASARQLLTLLADARTERERALARFDRKTVERLAPVLEEAAQIEASAVRLLTAMDGAGRFLARDEQAERPQLPARPAAGQSCLPLQAARERALSALEAKARAVDDVRELREMLAFRLEILTTAAELLPCRLVQLHAAGAYTGREPTQRDIEAIVSELRVLQETALAA